MKKGNHLYHTLDTYLTPIIEKFAFKPDKDFARYSFGRYNGKDIYYYAINGEMCFTLKEFAKFVNVPYSSVRKQFYRKSKEFLENLNETYLVEKRDYFKIDRADFLPMGPDVPLKKSGKEVIMLTFLGSYLLMPTFRDVIKEEVYRLLGKKLYDLIKSNQLISGEFFLTDKVGNIVHQVLGDKDRCYIDEKGYMYSSKGELLIAKTLRELRVKFQYNAPIPLPEWLINKILKEIHKEVLIAAKWYTIPSYITVDFLLRTQPRTIIEYWGLEDNDAYNAKREIKEFIYNELKISFVSIEPHEDQNIPVLKQKLMKELQLER